MYAQKEKRKKNKSSAVANSIAQQKRVGEQCYGFVNNRPEAKKTQLLGMVNNYAKQQFQPIQKRENKIRSSDNLKTHIENLSGYYFNDVEVQYNSDMSAQSQTQAQALDIHIDSGREKHLPHETRNCSINQNGWGSAFLFLRKNVPAINQNPIQFMGGEELNNFKARMSRERTVDGEDIPEIGPLINQFLSEEKLLNLTLDQASNLFSRCKIAANYIFNNLERHTEVKYIKDFSSQIRDIAITWILENDTSKNKLTQSYEKFFQSNAPTETKQKANIDKVKRELIDQTLLKSFIPDYLVAEQKPDAEGILSTILDFVRENPIVDTRYFSRGETQPELNPSILSRDQSGQLLLHAEGSKKELAKPEIATFKDDENDVEYVSGVYNFVVTDEEPPRVLCALEPDPEDIEPTGHTSLTNGNPVLWAGTAIYLNGRFLWTNNSGHYRPDRKKRGQALVARGENPLVSVLDTNDFVPVSLEGGKEVIPLVKLLDQMEGSGYTPENKDLIIDGYIKYMSQEQPSAHDENCVYDKMGDRLREILATIPKPAKKML